MKGGGFGLPGVGVRTLSRTVGVPGGLSETSVYWSSERQGTLGVRVLGVVWGRAFKLEGPRGLESSRVQLVLV